MTVGYHRFHGLDSKIVRIFNTYGLRMRLRDGRAVPAFMSAALRNEDVEVFGDGSQTRSFCYISDLVAGIIKLMRSGENEPVNIGNPHEMSVLQMAQTIYRAHRIEEPHHPQAAADRRPESAAARHHACENAAGVGAQGRPLGRPGHTIRYVRHKVTQASI